jgi:hypothetical protein
MPDSEFRPDEWVPVARLGRTRGLKGEIYGDSGIEAERLGRLEQVWLRTPEGAWVRDREPLEISRVRAYKDRLVSSLLEWTASRQPRRWSAAKC